MAATEYLFAVLISCTTLFPIFFILYKGGKNKLFFIASFIGVYTLIELLLVVTAFPVVIILLKVIPQFAEQNQVEYVVPLLYLTDFVEKWWFITLHVILCLWLPLAIYRRYGMFHITEAC